MTSGTPAANGHDPAPEREAEIKMARGGEIDVIEKAYNGIMTSRARHELDPSKKVLTVTDLEESTLSGPKIRVARERIKNPLPPEKEGDPKVEYFSNIATAMLVEVYDYELMIEILRGRDREAQILLERIRSMLRVAELAGVKREDLEYSANCFEELLRKINKSQQRIHKGMKLAEIVAQNRHNSADWAAITVVERWVERARNRNQRNVGSRQRGKETGAAEKASVPPQPPALTEADTLLD